MERGNVDRGGELRGHLENVQLIGTGPRMWHFLMAYNEFHPEGGMVQLRVRHIDEHILNGGVNA